MAQKQERVKKLSRRRLRAHVSRQDEELRGTCVRAASLAKADLLSGIVGEFPELQGVMGGEYALHDGESPAVAQAIREQYLPKAIEGELPKTLGERFFPWPIDWIPLPRFSMWVSCRRDQKIPLPCAVMPPRS